MRHSTSKFAFLLGATLLLTNCGKKVFTQDVSQASASPTASSESTPATNPADTTTTPVTTTPPSDTTGKDLLAQDACISTIQWFDNFNWIPYVSDQDCISKMKTLIRAQTGDLTMMNFEIRHVTKEQLKTFSNQAANTDQFIAIFEKQTTPIYGFYDGWINL